MKMDVRVLKVVSPFVISRINGCVAYVLLRPGEILTEIEDGVHDTRFKTPRIPGKCSTATQLVRANTKTVRTTSAMITKFADPLVSTDRRAK
jgi:hypothetical protein